MKYQNIHQEIIDQCIEGNTKAQFEIYKIYYKAMYNITLRIIQDKMEAEDIMQEAFLSAFKKINTYQGDVSFGAWLKKIVINKSLDSLKRKKVELIEINNQTMNLPENNEEIDFEKTNIKINQIKECINQLPYGYRIVLSLYLLEGYDHEEIGEILNISSSTSRSQFTRARKKLIEQLKLNSFSHYEKN
ncbi:MAG: sigma-70 family RNA polymerase sigma factor [Bacteroidales bacterium]|nr:sigma-70 family RNA polymerase sigma factor [Bacteroidales bacterium]